ncbi:MAG: four helix bundle protein [Bacteroidales bacterium]|mgnify:FL=1|nr:four helix bundle protein [Bacteroidales bacterium]
MAPEKTIPSFKFENLRLYFKAVDFANAILALAANCSNECHFIKLFIEEALNIATTIADGGSEGKSEFIIRLQETKQSIRKCIVYNTLAAKRNLIDADQENDIRNELLELTKMVSALTTSLQRHDITQDSTQEENIEY